MRGEEARAAQALGADDLPGPDVVAQSAQARRSTSSARRRSPTASSRAGEKDAYVAGMMERVGLDPSYRERLSAPVLGRAEAADRHCPRARGEAAIHRLRRIRRGARRLDPGADHQPVHGAEARARAHLSVHQPRHRRGEAYQRPRRDHVSRPHRRERPGGRLLRAAEPSLYGCAPRGGAHASPTGDESSRRSRARSRRRSHPPSGCHFHPALSARVRSLPRRRHRSCGRSRRAISVPAISTTCRRRVAGPTIAAASEPRRRTP